MTASAEPAVPPRRRMARADREQQLLEIAESVLVEQGYAAMTMDEVARRAGVTKPILYSHFGSKDGLVVACVARVRTELLHACERAIAAGGSPYERFRRGIRAFFDHIARHERAWSILLAEGLLAGRAGEEVEALRQQQADLISRLFAADGENSTRFDTYAQAVVGACERVALWRHGDPSGEGKHYEARPSVDDIAAYVADLFWLGLGKHAAARGSQWASGSV